MITYNDIYEAARKERGDGLQELPNNFIEEVANYLKEKKEFSSKEDDEFSDVILKTKRQLENAKTLFKEIILRRRKKILNLVLIATETGISKKDFDDMLNFEKKLFEELIGKIDSSDKSLNNVINGNDFKKEVKINNNQKIIFKEDVDEFVDFNGEMMGPFKTGDERNLPKEIVSILVEDGKVEVTE